MGQTSDKAFKMEAVRLAQNSGKSMRQIAEDLGVSVSGFSAWRKRPVSSRKREDGHIAYYLTTTHVPTRTGLPGRVRHFGQIDPAGQYWFQPTRDAQAGCDCQRRRNPEPV